MAPESGGVDRPGPSASGGPTPPDCSAVPHAARAFPGVRPARWLALSFLLTLFLRIPHYQHGFVFVDEAWWANGAVVLLDGGQLYRDVWLDKQPLIFWFTALLFRFLGTGTGALHAGVLLLVGGVSFLLYRIGARFFSPQAGCAAAVLYAIASTTYYTPRIIGMNAETLMVLFGCASLYCILLASEGEERPGAALRAWAAAFWAGLLALLASLAKPVAVVEFAALLPVALGWGLLKRESRGAGLRAPEGAAEGAGRRRWVAAAALMGAAAAGFACGLALLLLYLKGTGLLELWWQQTVVYELQYVSEIGFSRFISRLLRSMSAFGIVSLWLWLLVWKGLSRAGLPPRRRAVLVAWLVSALVGVALGRRFYANYFVELFPPMALTGGVGLVWLWQRRRLPGGRQLIRVAAAGLVLSSLWFHFSTLVHWYTLFDRAYHRQVTFWGMCRDSRRMQEVAAALRARTLPGEKIFVWGPRPEIYFLAGRRMATPFMEYDVGADVPPGAGRLPVQEQIVEQLRLQEVPYVVDAHRKIRLRESPPLAALVAAGYDLEEEFGEIRLYRRRP